MILEAPVVLRVCFFDKGIHCCVVDEVRVVAVGVGGDPVGWSLADDHHAPTTFGYLPGQCGTLRRQWTWLLVGVDVIVAGCVRPERRFVLHFVKGQRVRWHRSHLGDTGRQNGAHLGGLIEV